MLARWERGEREPAKAFLAVCSDSSALLRSQIRRCAEPVRLPTLLRFYEA